MTPSVLAVSLADSRRGPLMVLPVSLADSRRGTLMVVDFIFPLVLEVTTLMSNNEGKIDGGNWVGKEPRITHPEEFGKFRLLVLLMAHSRSRDFLKSYFQFASE